MDIEDEDGMESFEIDDRDIEYALNPNARRGLSKNQQLYGKLFHFFFYTKTEDACYKGKEERLDLVLLSDRCG